MEIQAAVLRHVKAPLSIETLQLAPPREGEVLLRMAAAGVCHSDWHVMTGATKHRLPVVPGHEGAGVVAEVGTGGVEFDVGDHVAINWSPACGSCFFCQRRQPYLCQAYVERIWSGVMLDGASRLSRGRETILQFHAVACFANYMVVPAACCVKMDRDVPLTVAALIGCATATGVGAVTNTAGVPPEASVAVFGAGGVGLNIILAARRAGANPLIAVDAQPPKLHMALAVGATDALLSTPHVNDQIRDLTSGRGADYVFEAVGRPEAQEQCFDAARPGGKIILAGLSPMDSQTQFPAALITRQEKTICGCYYGSTVPHDDFPRLAKLYKSGELPLDQLLTRTYALEEINQAYHDLLHARLARGLIVFPNN